MSKLQYRCQVWKIRIIVVAIFNSVTAAYVKKNRNVTLRFLITITNRGGLVIVMLLT
jgi:hypothetical protein